MNVLTGVFLALIAKQRRPFQNHLLVRHYHPNVDPIQYGFPPSPDAKRKSSGINGMQENMNRYGPSAAKWNCPRCSGRGYFQVRCCATGRTETSCLYCSGLGYKDIGPPGRDGSRRISCSICSGTGKLTAMCIGCSGTTYRNTTCPCTIS